MGPFGRPRVRVSCEGGKRSVKDMLPYLIIFIGEPFFDGSGFYHKQVAWSVSQWYCNKVS